MDESPAAGKRSRAAASRRRTAVVDLQHRALGRFGVAQRDTGVVPGGVRRFAAIPSGHQVLNMATKVLHLQLPAIWREPACVARVDAGGVSSTRGRSAAARSMEGKR